MDQKVIASILLSCVLCISTTAESATVAGDGISGGSHLSIRQTTTRATISRLRRSLEMPKIAMRQQRCGPPTCVKKSKARGICAGKEGMGCVVQKCKNGGYRCADEEEAGFGPSAGDDIGSGTSGSGGSGSGEDGSCDNRCYLTSHHAENACARPDNVDLGCSVNACYGPGGSGSTCSEGAVSDFISSEAYCLDPEQYSSFYQIGHTWPSAIVPTYSTADGDRTYVLFSCDSCADPQPCTGSGSCGSLSMFTPGVAMNDHGVSLDQVKAVCTYAGASESDGYPMYDCSGSYLQGALTDSLAGC